MNLLQIRSTSKAGTIWVQGTLEQAPGMSGTPPGYSGALSASNGPAGEVQVIHEQPSATACFTCCPLLKWT